MEERPQSVTTESSRRLTCGSRSIRLLAGAVVALLVSLSSPLQAQSPVTFRYFYDDAGQLQKVVDSTGVVLEYVYDAVGNILETRRSASQPGSLSLFNFTPGQGAPLTTITIRGQGFASTATGNIVRFNGVVATVISASIDTLVAVVPVGATSGPIAVTVNAATASSVVGFVVLQTPVITSVVPSVIDVARPPAAIQITGLNLAAATFAFLPPLQPSPITVGIPTVNSAGSAATLPLTVASSARGRFTLVGTTASGSSEAFPSKSNTVWVITAQDATDTDGDGFPDALEVQLGSDPFDPESIPILRGSGAADAVPFSVLKTIGIPTTPSTMEADAAPFSTLNLAGMSGGQPVRMEVVSATFSVLNTDPMAPVRASEDGGTGGGPAIPQSDLEADAVVFSVNNLAPNAPRGAVQAQARPVGPVGQNVQIAAVDTGFPADWNTLSTVITDTLKYWQHLMLSLPRRVP